MSSDVSFSIVYNGNDVEFKQHSDADITFHPSSANGNSFIQIVRGGHVLIQNNANPSYTQVTNQSNHSYNHYDLLVVGTQSNTINYGWHTRMVDGNDANENRFISGTPHNENIHTGLYCARMIAAGNAMAAYSDRRLKTNIQLIDISSALTNIISSKPCYYDVIPDFNETLPDIKKIGFIAQEIKPIFPRCIDFRSDFVRNIFDTARYIKDSSNNKIIHFRSVDKNVLQYDSSMNLFPYLKLQDMCGNMFDNVKIIDASFYNSDALDGSGNTHNIECVDLYIDYDKELTEYVFVEGQYVDNVQSIEYDQIFTNGVAAFQKLHSLFQEQDQKLISLENSISSLKTHIESIKN